MFFIKYFVVPVFLITSSLHLYGENEVETPTQRYLTTHSIDHIKPYMKNMGVTEEHVYAMKDAISNESTEGFFGYHGASREFRIYQDLIRFGIEEIVGIPIREDFHFLRIPGDPALNFDSAEDYLNRSISGTLPEGVNDSRYYLPLNIALYENFYFEELCSITGFAKGLQHKGFEKRLIPFFEKLGIDSQHIQKAFEIARSKIPNKGVLLQFFDTASYELADRFVYCSLSTGKPYFKDKKISEFILNPQQTAFPHLRLIVSNLQALNPNSSLVIKRYDLTNDYVQKAYEDALRKFLKSLPVDTDTAEKYKEELKSLWGN